MRRVYLAFGETEVLPGMDADQRKAVIERMFELCHKGIAFNMLEAE